MRDCIPACNFSNCQTTALNWFLCPSTHTRCSSDMAIVSRQSACMSHAYLRRDPVVVLAMASPSPRNDQASTEVEVVVNQLADRGGPEQQAASPQRTVIRSANTAKQKLSPTSKLRRNVDWKSDLFVEALLRAGISVFAALAVAMEELTTHRTSVRDCSQQAPSHSTRQERVARRVPPATRHRPLCGQAGIMGDVSASVQTVHVRCQGPTCKPAERKRSCTAQAQLARAG